MTQNANLLTYLQSHDGCTTFEATLTLGICRLSERVRELERLGYQFDKQSEQMPAGARVVRYRLSRHPVPACSAESYARVRG